MTFSKSNQRQILNLISGHCCWSLAILGVSLIGSQLSGTSLWWSTAFMLLQLYLAAQLLLPILLLKEEKRSRHFYLFWGGTLLLCIWLINQFPNLPLQQPLTAIKSGFLMLVATLVGAALARYVQRLWEIIPIGIAMTLADFASWMFGPTANFTEQLKQYYRHPIGPPPMIDMVLIKFATPGSDMLVPVFGISDWIMVVFFVMVADRFGINDNLIGATGTVLARQKKFGRYLPVSVVALFCAVSLAQISGVFIPALPLIALLMSLWYAIYQVRHNTPSYNKDHPDHD
jgi:hypothetical protein